MTYAGPSRVNDGGMTKNQDAYSERWLDTRLLIAGGVLMGLGAVIGLAGLALSGSAVLTGTRRWVRQMDVPPRELAKQKLTKARAATSAGVEAWQHNGAATADRQ
jgi:hypothetical protein